MQFVNRLNQRKGRGRSQIMCMRIIKTFVMLTLLTMLLGPFFLLKAYTQSLEVIETFEAGPEKVQKKVSGVKTNYSWTKPGSCNCPNNEGPCIQSFLDKRIPQLTERYPSRIEDYYIQNKIGSEYQGAGQVPWGIDFASVRLLNIPFCGQEKRAAKRSKSK